MDAALLGAMSAVSFGCADFIARFTGRQLGIVRAVVAIALMMGRRLDALQWAATLIVFCGMVVTARFVGEPQTAARLTRSTLAIAVAASVSYAGLVTAAQAVVPVLGDAVTALSGRLIAI